MSDSSTPDFGGDQGTGFSAGPAGGPLLAILGGLGRGYLANRQMQMQQASMMLQRQHQMALDQSLINSRNDNTAIRYSLAGLAQDKYGNQVSQQDAMDAMKPFAQIEAARKAGESPAYINGLIRAHIGTLSARPGALAAYTGALKNTGYDFGTGSFGGGSNGGNGGNTPPPPSPDGAGSGAGLSLPSAPPPPSPSGTSGGGLSLGLSRPLTSMIPPNAFGSGPAAAPTASTPPSAPSTPANPNASNPFLSPAPIAPGTAGRLANQNRGLDIRQQGNAIRQQGVDNAADNNLLARQQAFQTQAIQTLGRVAGMDSATQNQTVKNLNAQAAALGLPPVRPQVPFDPTGQMRTVVGQDGVSRQFPILNPALELTPMEKAQLAQANATPVKVANDTTRVQNDTTRTQIQGKLAESTIDYRQFQEQRQKDKDDVASLTRDTSTKAKALAAVTGIESKLAAKRSMIAALSNLPPDKRTAATDAMLSAAQGDVANYESLEAQPLATAGLKKMPNGRIQRLTGDVDMAGPYGGKGNGKGTTPDSLPPLLEPPSSLRAPKPPFVAPTSSGVNSGYSGTPPKATMRTPAPHVPVAPGATVKARTGRSFSVVSVGK